MMTCTGSSMTSKSFRLFQLAVANSCANSFSSPLLTARVCASSHSPVKPARKHPSTVPHGCSRFGINHLLVTFVRSILEKILRHSFGTLCYDMFECLALPLRHLGSATSSPGKENGEQWESFGCYCTANQMLPEQSRSGEEGLWRILEASHHQNPGKISPTRRHIVACQPHGIVDSAAFDFVMGHSEQWDRGLGRWINIKSWLLPLRMLR
jgi:hypothetical protein